MKKQSILVMIGVVLIGGAGIAFSEDLFSEDIPAKPVIIKKINPAPAPKMSPPLFSTTEKQKKNVSLKTSDTYRFYGLNVESLIARGDIRLTYEVPLPTEWAGFFMAHVNPHDHFAERTGRYGLFGGGRLYLEEDETGPFLQLLGGFNYEESDEWALAVELFAGYKLHWRDTSFLEGGLSFNRSYADAKRDPTLNLVFGITMGLDYRLIPVL
ncbi:hypothetical protein DID77_00640 [Candidatus Marinamargulisbacteria bacterium SCGC AG-439-L15]|nr:hypothetical protein DID77_00640 [Candidatus Marinamargulisbacteria bacterium SCGC AG-439-L15]